jgi:hypothetical protein
VFGRRGYDRRFYKLLRRQVSGRGHHKRSCGLQVFSSGNFGTRNLRDLKVI